MTIASPVLLRVLSRMCQFTAITLCVPALVDYAFYDEHVGRFYLITALAAAVVSLILPRFAEPARTGVDQLTRREGFLAVVASWLIIILFGAIPFWISGDIASLVDAIFESASGFSTTGATILPDIEILPHAHLLQRSLAQWIGGMGIIVLSVAILPELAVGGMQLFAAEASGISTDKLSPRIVQTARRLWQVYVGMTVVLVGLLMFGGMDTFDAITHSFGTVATGGFSTRNASVGAFNSVYIETVITIFMLAAGMSFALHYRLLVRREASPMLRSEEVRVYLGIFTAFTLMIAGHLVYTGNEASFATALRHSAFQTAAIITTTGYGTADFDMWSEFSRYLLVLLMFMGGCAGSTAGGVKVIRIVVVYKHAVVELRKLVYPNLVHPVTVANRTVTQSTIQGILGYFLLYISTTVVGIMLILLLSDLDLVSGATAVISAMNSIGPGLGAVGPTMNYSQLPDSCKLILSACMIVGRLEIYTVIVLFSSAFFKR